MRLRIDPVWSDGCRRPRRLVSAASVACLLVAVSVLSFSTGPAEAPVGDRLLAGGIGGAPSTSTVPPSTGGRSATSPAPVDAVRSDLPAAPSLPALSPAQPVRPAPPVDAGAGGAITGPLRTQGNAIVDGVGVAISLRGVVNDLLDWNSSVWNGSSLDDRSIGQTRLWGANMVRVLLSESFWNSSDCHYVPTYAAAVDQVVRSITTRGMVALLDLHNNGRTRCEASNEQRMADYPGSVEFWRSVASRYRTNPLVAFDLYNEPHDITWQQWLNGGALVDPDGVAWQAAGMQQLYDAVRSLGAPNLVFVSGNSWANLPPPQGYLVNGFNIVYAAHEFTCPHDPPPTCTAPDPYNPAPAGERLDVWTPFLGGHPVVVTEFGWPDPYSGTYNENVIDWAQSKKVGWTAYNWAPGVPGGTGAFGILQDLVNYQPAPSGVPVKTNLQKYSGIP